MHYPSYLFSINETQTAKNLRDYDERKRKEADMIENKIRETIPGYDFRKCNLIERRLLEEKAKRDLGLDADVDFWERMLARHNEKKGAQS